jgi:short-subunit dehydrogenase
MTQLRGKNVLITGAAHGIGKLMAEKISCLGGSVILCDVNREGLEETAKEISTKGSTVYVKIFDISKRDEVYKAAKEIKNEIGNVDVLINNAGIVFPGEIMDVSDDKHLKTIEVNLCGTLWMLKAFAPDMIKRNEGHIVNISSSAGLLGMPGMGVYSATKFALMGLNEALRLELGNHKSKVKTTVVCPYLINTGMFEGMKTPLFFPPLKPEAMADAVVKGILNDRKLIGKPFTVFLPSITKAFFPSSVLDFSVRMLGFNKAIYSCKGFQRKG